jgi:hypothetical protein
MSTLTAALALFGVTVVGIILTLIAGQEPGVLLGAFVIIGSFAAVLGIRRSGIYLLFPLPALAAFAGALATGIVHDSELASSTAGLGAGFAQWVGGIFFPMVIATIVVVLIGGCRWLFGSQLVTSHVAPPGGRAAVPGNARPAPGRKRPAPEDSWTAEETLTSNEPKPRRTGPPPRTGTSRSDGPRPENPRSDGQRSSGLRRTGSGGFLSARAPREQGTDRDPWGDPRLPGGRGTPGSGNRSTSGPGLGDRNQQSARPRPAGSSPAPQPRDRTPPAPQPRDRTPRPQPGPSWNQTARPQPPRRQPPEGWGSR